MQQQNSIVQISVSGTSLLSHISWDELCQIKVYWYFNIPKWSLLTPNISILILYIAPQYFTHLIAGMGRFLVPIWRLHRERTVTPSNYRDWCVTPSDNTDGLFLNSVYWTITPSDNTLGLLLKSAYWGWQSCSNLKLSTNTHSDAISRIWG